MNQGMGIGSVGGAAEILNRMAREGILEKELSEFISKGNKGAPCGHLEEESYR